ncbi:unnamed protein product [Knipowitschia caucasica]
MSGQRKAARGQIRNLKLFPISYS